MAKAHRFNPPPTWPAPPPGWTPPPGWQPDPSWPPPPEGWQLWEEYRPNRLAYAWSLGSALVLYVLLLVIGSAVAGGAPSAETAGRVLGPPLFGGLVVGTIAYFSSGRWSRWVYPLAVLGAGLVLSAISTVGQTTGA